MGLYDDVEKHPAPVEAELARDDAAVLGPSLERSNTLFSRLRRFTAQYGVEQRGIERVSEDQRTDTKGALNIFTLVRNTPPQVLFASELL